MTTIIVFGKNAFALTALPASAAPPTCLPESRERLSTSFIIAQPVLGRRFDLTRASWLLEVAILGRDKKIARSEIANPAEISSGVQVLSPMPTS